MKIAVIGGIGSGKSSVIQLLKRCGEETVDCDKISHEIMLERDCVNAVEKAFASVVQDGNIDKKKLGAIVFSDKEKLSLLNGIMHPFVKERLHEAFNEFDGKDIFVEVSAYFGSGLEHDVFDKIICVVADDDIRIARVIQRSGYSLEHCLNIIARQPLQNDMLKVSDFVIENNGDECELEKQVLLTLRSIKSV